jgi:GAF domain-containing protein/anti-sigma regulatory factor (Ser/Thr protein kinase)
VILMSVVWDDIGGLAHAHEQFVAGDPVEADVRSSILTSWQRCRSLGLVPDSLVIPYEQDLDVEERLLRAAEPVLDRMVSVLAGARVSVILTDSQARVLLRRGGDAGLDQRLDAVRLAPGFGFAEQSAGTNGIGTALAERRPCYVFGREHFADCMQPFACAAAPVRNPLSGQVEGVLDLTCFRADADPAMLTLVRQTVAGIEQRLLEQTTDRERDLLAAFQRARRFADEPARPPDDGEATGLVAPSDDVISRFDQAILRDKAEELIASPHRTATEVTLSGGRTAVLLCREVRAPSGEVGVVVEASLPGGPARRRIAVTTPHGSAPHWESLLEPQQQEPTPDAPAVPAAQAPGTEGWLLLVGEPGVGRLALLARRRLELLHDASVRIGTTLDVTRTAEELTEVAVPQFADYATVDLPESVLRGEEPAAVGVGLRRVALGAINDGSNLFGVGDSVGFLSSTPQARCLACGQPVLEPELNEAGGWIANAPGRSGKIMMAGIHSLIAVPLIARGVILGVVCFYRSQRPGAFEEDDVSLAHELVGRAAICIDNARRFTREHNMALALQRSLLPQGMPEQNAVEVAYRYLPARAGVGGDWFDVIPLSGARVALIVGDVVGHGVHAAATMGRLRTAVHNFSALDLPPEDLLGRLDELLARLDTADPGATCLYAVYDPVTRHCTLARAGHLLPVVVLPDGTAYFPDVPAGLPLGLGGPPFEAVDLTLPEGSRLVLYTDGLIEHRSRDIDLGLEQLRTTLAARPGAPPEETCEAVLDAMLPVHPAGSYDDVALLVARTRALDPGRTVHWDIPADPAAVSRSRSAVIALLADWGLDELAFTTELIVSELVTNAIRYGVGPIGLRLLRDRALICEVSDCSSTSPRLRRARTTDEGGRGLFLVAQLADRWGTRYTANGKAIWTEQQLP